MDIPEKQKKNDILRPRAKRKSRMNHCDSYVDSEILDNFDLLDIPQNIKSNNLPPAFSKESKLTSQADSNYGNKLEPSEIKKT